MWDWSKAPRSFQFGIFTLRPLGPKLNMGLNGIQYRSRHNVGEGKIAARALHSAVILFRSPVCLPLHFTLLPANWNDILSTPTVIKQVKGLKRTQSYSAGSVPNINRLLTAAKPTVWWPNESASHSYALFLKIRFNPYPANVENMVCS